MNPSAYDIEKEAFLKSLREKIKADAEERKKKEASREKELLQKGYTHRTDVCIHNQGDDKILTYYTIGEPTPSMIARWLKNSVVKDDFYTRPLKVEA